MMRLRKTGGESWAFFFNDSIVQIIGYSQFFAGRKSAVEAAERVGFRVARDGNCYS